MITYEKIDFSNNIDEAIRTEILKFEYNHLIDTLRALNMEFNENKRRLFFKENEIAIICRNDHNNIVGLVEYGTGLNHNKNEIYITGLYVTPKYIGNKFLMNILGYMIKDLREKQFDYLTCHVHQSNRKAIHLYKRLGFQFNDIEGNNNQVWLKIDKKILNTRRATKLYNYYAETQPFK